MKSIKIFLAVAFLFIFTFNVQAQSSPFFSDEIINNIINEISGEKALHNTILLTPYERNRPESEYTGMFRESEYTLKLLKEYGFSEARVEKWFLPSHEWDAEKAELWMVEPERKKICDYSELTACLAVLSGSGNVEAEVIDIGVGNAERDYEGKNVKGKIVLGTGSSSAVYKIAVREKGAAGVVIYGDSPVAVDHPDQINWNPLRLVDKSEKAETFCFKLSDRQGRELKRYLRNGRVVLKADVKVTYYPEKIEVPTALIPGNGETEQEIIYLAHIFDQIPKQGANDNISGSAAILEIGRAIITLLKENKIPPLRRGIRFLWIPEVTGTTAYFNRYPAEIEKLVAGINMDMVGESMRLCNSIFKTRMTPHSMPSYINAIFKHAGELTVDLQDRLTAPSGTRDHFYYRFIPYESGSDQLVMNDSYLKVPTLFLGCWPDNFYHSSQDLPDKTDPTTLKRAVFLGLYGGLAVCCAAPDDAVKIASESFTLAKETIAGEVNRVITMLDNAEPGDLSRTLYRGNIMIDEAFARETGSVKSSKIFADGRKTVADKIDITAEYLLAEKENTVKYIQNHYRYLCKLHKMPEKKYTLSAKEEKYSKIIPVKTAPRERILKNIFGRPSHKSFRPWSETYSEVFNFIDGKRSILDIANAMEIQFNRPYLDEVAEYLEILKKDDYISY